jgi:hypothetical protein
VKVRSSSKSWHLSPRAAGPAAVADHSVLREEDFLRVIGRERKRAERSQKPSLLMLIDREIRFPFENNDKTSGKMLQTMLSALATTTRETDVTGWYKDDCVVGVMFTEVTVEDGRSIVATVMTRVRELLRSRLSSREFNQLNISFHLFPESCDEQIPVLSRNPGLYPDVSNRDGAEKLIPR